MLLWAAAGTGGTITGYYGVLSEQGVMGSVALSSIQDICTCCIPDVNEDCSVVVCQRSPFSMHMPPWGPGMPSAGLHYGEITNYLLISMAENRMALTQQQPPGSYTMVHDKFCVVAQPGPGTAQSVSSSVVNSDGGCCIEKCEEQFPRCVLVMVPKS